MLYALDKLTRNTTLDPDAHEPGHAIVSPQPSTAGQFEAEAPELPSLKDPEEAPAQA